MTINDKDAIEIARNFLEKECADAAEPLWDLDDFGNPIDSGDIGCATWVCCELFEIQDDPEPKVHRDEKGVTVVIQAKVKWEHWNYTTIREFCVPIVFEDEDWSASDMAWGDVGIDAVEDGQIDEVC